MCVTKSEGTHCDIASLESYSVSISPSPHATVSQGSTQGDKESRESHPQCHQSHGVTLGLRTDAG